MCLLAWLVASALGGLPSLLRMLAARSLGPTKMASMPGTEKMAPASATEAKMWAAVSQSHRLCSMSTVSQSRPLRAMKRAAVMLAKDSQVPKEGLPAFKVRLTALGRMQDLRKIGVPRGTVVLGEP